MNPTTNSREAGQTLNLCALLSYSSIRFGFGRLITARIPSSIVNSQIGFSAEDNWYKMTAKRVCLGLRAYPFYSSSQLIDQPASLVLASRGLSSMPLPQAVSCKPLIRFQCHVNSQGQVSKTDWKKQSVCSQLTSLGTGELMPVEKSLNFLIGC